MAQSERAHRARGVWFVQLVEYVIGFGVAGGAANAQHQLPLALVALLVLLNVAVVKGPLSAFQIVPLAIHRWTGLIVAGVALFAAVFLTLDTAGRLTLLAAATTQGFVSIRFAHGFRTTST